MFPVRRSLSLLSTLVALWLPSGAFASSVGQFMISGTVASVNTLSVIPNGSSNQNLDVTGGETGRNVATVIETSNDANGYTVTLSSANAGKLELSGHPGVSTTYQLSYDGGAYAQPSGTATVVKNVTSLPGQTTSSSTVLVNVTAYPAAPAGVYSDTLTLSIVAN